MSDQPERTVRSRAKAGRTRAAILEAAEQVFAAKGYAAARLSDVASAVGIRRPSLLYHVRDKRDLYDTVLASLFDELQARYRKVLDAPAALPRRIEAIIETWVAFVGERPTLAHLLLWEAADGSQRRPVDPNGPSAAIVAMLADTIAEGQRQGCFQPIDPIHFIVTIMGATVFFVTVTPHLMPAWPIDPLSPGQLAAHRTELLGIAHRLLGSSVAPDTRGSEVAAAVCSAHPQPSARGAGSW